jgi:hypothetical protein
MLFAAVHESAYGTLRHFAALQNLSAIGVIVLQKYFHDQNEQY